MSTDKPFIPSLYVYQVEDAVKGGTLIVTTFQHDRLMKLITEARENTKAGWTQEDLLELLVELQPHKIRVVLSYSAEVIDHKEGAKQEPLLYTDGRIHLNGDISVERYEESIQKLAETDSLAQSIAKQIKRRKEEKELKPKFDVKKVLVAEKVEKKTIEAVEFVPEAVKVIKKTFEAVPAQEVSNKSMTDRTINAVKLL